MVDASAPWLQRFPNVPFYCGQSIVGVRAAGIDHYEANRYYCRCNKCHKSGEVRGTLVDAIEAWRHEHGEKEKTT